MNWWKVALSGVCVVDLGERYVKQSIRNRLMLCDVKGSFLWSFALDHVARKASGPDAPMASLPLSRHIPHRNLLKSLATSYGRSPYYEHVMPEIESWFKSDTTIGELAWKSIEWMADWGQVEKLPERSEERLPYLNQSLDFRVDDKLDPGHWEFASYPQPFEDRNGFVGGCSGLDAVMGLGRDWPEAARNTANKTLNLQS
jgi:hypothetical protein